MARAPEAPPERAIGGGPIDPSCVIHSPSEAIEVSASSSPASASDVAATASSAPPAAVDLAADTSSAAPEAITGVESRARPERASSMRRARGGGPVPEELNYTATTLRPRPRPRIARFMLGVGGGTGMFTAESDGRNLGPAWYVGTGLEVARVLTIEGRYQGGHNVVPVGLDPSGSYGVVFNGATGLVRLALPTPYVSPYVQSGIGYLWFSPTGSAQGQQSIGPSGLTNLPVGGGIEFRFTRAVGLDLEYTNQFLLDSRWTFDHASHPWGDLWNASAALRFYL
jgi:hypothetical protein